jgi:hypothetical protein
MNRLFICGITCGSEIDKIKELVEKTKDYVDGYVWTVDSLSIGSVELIDFLEANKKAGKIVSFPWSNQHDMQAQMWLTSGALKDSDYVWMFDSSECPTEDWLKCIRQNIEDMEKNKIGAVYCSNRPYLFKWQDTLYFHGTPHWGLFGFWDVGTNIIPEDRKSNFIINKRDLNPAKHYQEHDTKYYLYGRSNIIPAFYGKYGQKKVELHDALRIMFRGYLKKNFGEASLKTLDALFAIQPKDWVDGDFVTDMIEMEFCLSEYYRKTILKEDFMLSIVPKRELWSFKNFLLYNDGFYNKSYLGTRPRYDKLLEDKNKLIVNHPKLEPR